MKIHRRYFYKYKSLENYCREYTRKILLEDKIYFPRFKELNDPQDGSIYFSKNYKKKDMALLINKLNDMFDNADYDVNDFIGHDGSLIEEKINILNGILSNTQDMYSIYGVMCLSETCINPVMWAHYSKNAGICIEFDGLNSELQNPLFNHKVKYTKTYPIVKLTDFAKGEMAVRNIFYRKYKDWRYEKEWRYLNDEGGKEWEIPGIISSIIFGLKTNDKDQEEIKVIAKNRSIPLKKVVLSKTKYEYELVDY